jgi:hypothetical protein
MSSNLRRTSPRRLGVALGVAAALASPCFGGVAGDAWSRLDRFLATFNPAGHYIREPIEKQIPALVFKGFLRQWSDVSLTDDQQVGFRNKDFRFLQLQNLLETELHYFLAPNIEITNVNHFLYDGVYNWQQSEGLFAPRVSETARVYHDTERIVRELYVSYRSHAFDLTLGKQQVAWGKMDGQFIDIVNPMDRRESVQLETSDYEYRRLPTWMGNFTYFFGKNSIQLLYIPNFEQDRLTPEGSPWFPPSVPPPDSVVRAELAGNAPPVGPIVLDRQKPKWSHFDDHQGGVRVDFSMDPVTWGLIYFNGWDDNATNAIVGRVVENGVPRLVVQPQYRRLNHLGVTSDYATSFPAVPMIGPLPVVLRVEALYTLGVPFEDFARRAEAELGSLNSGVVERDTLRAAVALEFALPWNTTLLLQPSLYYTFDYRRTLGPGFGGAYLDEWNLVPVFYVDRPFLFTRDRLRVNFTAYPIVGGPRSDFQGVKTKLIASYTFSQYIVGKLIYTAYSGGKNVDLYGQYDKWDNIGWELSYEF